MAIKPMHLGFFFATVAALCGCGKNPGTAKEVTSVSVNGVSLTLGTGAVEVTQGTETSLWVGIDRQTGHQGVALDVTGEVAGISHRWVKGTAGDDSSLVISVGAGVAVGSYPLSVVGNLTGGGQLTSALQVTVQPAHSTFAMVLQPSVFEIYNSSGQTIELQLQRLSGFTGAVTVTVEGDRPSGLAVEVGSNVGDKVQVTVTADASVAPGNYDLVVRGVAQGETREVPMRVISRAGQPSLTLTVGSPLAVSQNSRVERDVTTAATSVSVEGLPRGILGVEESSKDGTHHLAFYVTGEAAVGPATATVRAELDGVVRLANLSLNVTASPFSIDDNSQGRGQLDTTFGFTDTGTVVLPVEQGLPVFLADGSVVVVHPRGLQRIDTQGRLDSTYGRGSVDDHTTALPTQAQLQPDGKLAVVYAEPATGPDGTVTASLLIKRFDATGKLDSTFGTGGAVKVADARQGTLTVAQDNRITVAYDTVTNALGLSQLAADGQLDTQFDTDGRVQVALDGQVTLDMAQMADDGQGHLLVAIVVDDLVRLYRFNRATGALDASFGTGGHVNTPVAATSVSGGSVLMRLDAQGRIVVTSNRDDVTGQQITVARFKADGTADASFGDHGQVSIGGLLVVHTVDGLAIQGDQILIAGYQGLFSGGSDAFVLRLNADGSTDTGFGAAGQVVIGTSLTVAGSLQAEDDHASTIAIDSQGRAMVGSASGSLTVLMRLNK